MEQNATNAARLEIFTNKTVGKSRFNELPAEEIQKFMDNAVAVKKQATKIGIRPFNGKYPLSFAQKLQNFKFYSFLRTTVDSVNVTEQLASPGDINFCDIDKISVNTYVRTPIS